MLSPSAASRSTARRTCFAPARRRWQSSPTCCAPAIRVHACANTSTRYLQSAGYNPRTMASHLFATKPLKQLLEEMQGEERLRRVLGPVQLTALGVGAVIGTGIFILTGQAAHDK